jgi:hypothetical protein
MEKLEQIVESLQDNKNNKDETVSDSQHWNQPAARAFADSRCNPLFAEARVII